MESWCFQKGLDDGVSYVSKRVACGDGVITGEFVDAH